MLRENWMKLQLTASPLSRWGKWLTDSPQILANLLLALFVDILFFDDEPLWEPVEWSMIQSWILFLFIFAWIGELLIAARFGSYTGRDKRIWIGWYRTFWFLEYLFIVNFGLISFFIITPFYSEITYQTALIISWWDWLSRNFFFRFLSGLTFIMLLSSWALLASRWVSWRNIVITLLLVEMFFSYFFFWQFITTYFAYFSDPIWYQKTRPISLIQNSHGPARWGWGPALRDYFTYHRTTTTFWMKTNLPFTGAFLLINFFLLLSLFLINFFWLSLLRRIYALREVPLTFLVYVLSSLRAMLIAFGSIVGLLLFSLILAYWRLPLENFWIFNITSFGYHTISFLVLFW